MNDHPTTREELAWYAIHDPKYLIESGFWLVNKQGQSVPFIFNELQNEYYYNRTYRDDILKGSQLGFSTLILAILTVRFIFVPNRWGISISHESGATERLFLKPKYFLEHCDPWMKRYFTLETDNKENMRNSQTNSMLYIGTAGAKSFGRGDTIHDAHMSEISRWRGAEELVTTIMRAMPDDPTTWAVKETTANGQGNFHHSEWEREKKSESEFRPHFMAWFKHEDYLIPGATVENFTEEEVALMNKHPEITEERIAWRRRKIKMMPKHSDKGYTPEQLFKQEYPCDDIEAFLFSGNPFFPVEQTERYKNNAEEPKFQGNMFGVHPNVKFDEAEGGFVRIYKEPERDGQYVIGADVSRNGDYCSADVIDKKTRGLVAKWHGHINPGKFGDELTRLGYYYNTAELAIEANNMGQSTVDRIVTLNYPNIYMREILNKKTKKVTKEFGWWTDAKSRPLMLGYSQELVRQEIVDIPDLMTIKEMITFVINLNGKPEASEGNNDDCVISFSIGQYVAKLHPYVYKKEATKATPMQKKGQAFKQFRSGARSR